ncbi:LOG family protein [Candidatus Woesebacteria bacterium]|nr:MAG: LOG family protein [Candidatus Woesebacteria bacterium]
MTDQTIGGHQPINAKLIRQVAYFGWADTQREDPLYEEAVECAKFLTQKGYVAINGGGPGTMRAVTEGAKEAGGTAIGVTFYPKDITNFEGRDMENKFDQEIVTENYLERTLKLLELGDIYVVFNGGTGTVSEFGMTWAMAKLYFGRHKPLILYGKFWHNIVNAFRDNMHVGDIAFKVFRIVETPDEAYEAILYFEEMLAKNENRVFNPPEKPFQL